MNVSLAVNLSEVEGNTRLILHTGLAASGIVAFLLGGIDLLRPAWEALRQRRIVTEHLFLAGIAAAWLVSLNATLTGEGAVFYEVPILLPSIRRLGSILLGRQRSGIEAAIQGLFANMETARVSREGAWTPLPLSDVVPGDRLLVEAGETIPADSTITAGRAYVRTGKLTGEPFPVVIEPGGRVTSGMVPMDGALEMEVRCAPEASMLSDIASSTRELLDRPPVFLRSVEKVLRWFFPTVLSVSVGTLLFWAWFADWQSGIIHSLAVVLVACPCAFGVALPLLYRRGLVGFLRRGIEPTDSGFMESLSMVKVVAFDKTGTLTLPEMSVESLECAPGVCEADLRVILAALHARSDHPVARPFWNWTSEAAEVEVKDLRVQPGRGVEALVRLKGRWLAVKLGNASILTMSISGLANPSAGQRRIYIEIDGILSGVCLLAEHLRSHATAACHSLATRGWDVTVITGDAAVPEDISVVVGEIHVSQLPQEKARIVALLESSGKPVLYLGDGVNDANALATATAGIAVGNSAALAGASAQAVWRHPDFSLLPGLLEESRAMADRARLILRTALVYNFGGMAIAAAGLLHPVAAAVIMLVSSATVMTLAARPLSGVSRKNPRAELHPITL